MCVIITLNLLEVGAKKKISRKILQKCKPVPKLKT